MVQAVFTVHEPVKWAIYRVGFWVVCFTKMVLCTKFIRVYPAEAFGVVGQDYSLDSVVDASHRDLGKSQVSASWVYCPFPSHCDIIE
jgi:hypothetical protein